MPKIHGARIILREYREEDLIGIHSWVNNPKIVDMLSDFMFPHTKHKTEKFLEDMLEQDRQDRCGFVIAHRNSEEYIGQIDLMNIHWKNRRASIGIIIGREEDHHKGYGTEAMQLLLEYGFYRLGLNKIELEVREYNKGGIRCYEKCGFKIEGIFKEDFYIHGKYTDTLRMAVLKSEWEVGRDQ